MKIIEIGGVHFELVKNTRSSFHVSGASVYDVYARPSQAKQAIYRYWTRFYIENGGWDFGVQSRNSQTFTVGFFIEHEGKPYYCYITAYHNYTMPV